MIISDLNYLENTSEEVLGGFGVNINSNLTVFKNVQSFVNETYVKTVVTNLGALQGNVAEVIATADATGNNTFTSIVAGTQTEDNRSESIVNVISATR